MSDKNRCSVTVHVPGQMMGAQCGNNAVVQVGERWFCGVHNPEHVAKRNAAKQARWKEESRLTTNRFKRDKLIRDLAEWSKGHVEQLPADAQWIVNEILRIESEGYERG